MGFSCIFDILVSLIFKAQTRVQQICENTVGPALPFSAQTRLGAGHLALAFWQAG